MDYGVRRLKLFWASAAVGTGVSILGWNLPKIIVQLRTAFMGHIGAADPEGYKSLLEVKKTAEGVANGELPAALSQAVVHVVHSVVHSPTVSPQALQFLHLAAQPQAMALQAGPTQALAPVAQQPEQFQPFTPSHVLQSQQQPALADGPSSSSASPAPAVVYPTGINPVRHPSQNHPSARQNHGRNKATFEAMMREMQGDGKPNRSRGRIHVPDPVLPHNDVSNDPYLIKSQHNSIVE